MGKKAEQGDLIRVEKISSPILVVSKNFFNESGEAIGCPVVKEAKEGPLHLWIETQNVKGYVLCEEMKLLDLKKRRYHGVGRIAMGDIVNATDAIQSIFDYV